MFDPQQDKFSSNIQQQVNKQDAPQQHQEDVSALSGQSSFAPSNSPQARATAQLKNTQDNSPQARITNKLKGIQDNSPQARITNKLKGMQDNSPQAKITAQLKNIQDNSPQAKITAQLKEAQQAGNTNSQGGSSTGLPAQLKTGIENLSGMDMSDVKVHYNSSKPAQLKAHAYAQGTDIHMASGQEQHLPHEAWHVVQQKQNRVQPTLQMKGGTPINDDKGLEKEADVMGAKAMSSGTTVQKKAVQTGSFSNSQQPVQRITKDEYDNQVTDADIQNAQQAFYKDENNNDITKASAWNIIAQHAGNKLADLSKDQAIDIIHHLYRDKVYKDDNNKMHQNTDNMDQLYERAALVHAHFDMEIHKLGKKYGAIQTMAPEGLKKKPRANKKVKTKYKGDASRLNDLVRATMIFSSYKKMNAAINQFKNDYKAVVQDGLLDFKDEREIKNKGQGSGYTDVKLIFPFQNHVVELQMNVKAMQDLKDSGGHALYDILRFFDEDTNATQFTPPTPQKQQKMKKQMAKVKKYIDNDIYLMLNKGYRRVVDSVLNDLKQGDGTVTLSRKDVDLLREVSYAWYKQADDKMSASGQMIMRGGSLIERSSTFGH